MAQENGMCRGWHPFQQDSARATAVVASVQGRLMLLGSRTTASRDGGPRRQSQHMHTVDPVVRLGNGAPAVHLHAISLSTPTHMWFATPANNAAPRLAATTAATLQTFVRRVQTGCRTRAWGASENIRLAVPAVRGCGLKGVRVVHRCGRRVRAWWPCRPRWCPPAHVAARRPRCAVPRPAASPNTLAPHRRPRPVRSDGAA